MVDLLSEERRAGSVVNLLRGGANQRGCSQMQGPSVEERQRHNQLGIRNSMGIYKLSLIRAGQLSSMVPFFNY